MTNTAKATIANITTNEYITLNVIPAVRPIRMERNIVSAPILDVELYYRVMTDLSTDGIASYKMTADLMRRNNLDEPYLRSCAWANTYDKLTCAPLADLLGMGEPDDTYVLSTTTGFCGAAAHLICHDKIRSLCQKTGVKKWFVFPSSIHELIVRPYDPEEKEYADAMVKTINATEVAPDEVLADHCYIYDYLTDSITY